MPQMGQQHPTSLLADDDEDKRISETKKKQIEKYTNIPFLLLQSNKQD